MYQHIIDYLIIRYNGLWDYMSYLAIKPEYGGSGDPNWRKKLDSVAKESDEIEAKINCYRKQQLEG